MHGLCCICRERWLHDSENFFCLLSFARHKQNVWLIREGDIPFAEPIPLNNNTQRCLQDDSKKCFFFDHLKDDEGTFPFNDPIPSSLISLFARQDYDPMIHIWLKAIGRSRRLTCICLKAQYELLYFKLQLISLELLCNQQISLTFIDSSKGIFPVILRNDSTNILADRKWK